MRGFVTLVGAGPGDPGLLTRAGEAVLREAEVVVYDRLVAPALLELIPAEAKRINVGKNAGHHPVPQEEINRILLAEAQKGLRVVRLKGGDPFLFGRGGEELELLAQHGIPFRVIPGVTSAISVPAYAGIPVTHRDCCSSLHIITGHPRADGTSRIDYDSLVRTGGTLVFLMGLSALPEICGELLRAGMPQNMPAAIIERGTTPHQRSLVATVSTLTEEARAQGFRSPVILVFGEVCRYAEVLDWFPVEERGPAVILTRPESRMEPLARPLRTLGVRVVEYPCIETTAALEGKDWIEAIENLACYQWVVFTSPAGPELFRQALFIDGNDLRHAAHLKFAVIGPGTQAALREIGICADLMPEVYDSAHLAQALVQEGAQEVLLFRSAQGSPVLPELLRTHGIEFDDVACYDTVYTSPDPASVLSALQEEGSLVAFTSASTVRGFVRSLPSGTDFTRLTACCIGAVTCREAEKYGFSTLVAEEATVDGLLALIQAQLLE